LFIRESTLCHLKHFSPYQLCHDNALLAILSFTTTLSTSIFARKSVRHAYNIYFIWRYNGDSVVLGTYILGLGTVVGMLHLPIDYYVQHGGTLSRNDILTNCFLLRRCLFNDIATKPNPINTLGRYTYLLSALLNIFLNGRLKNGLINQAKGLKRYT